MKYTFIIFEKYAIQYISVNVKGITYIFSILKSIIIKVLYGCLDILFVLQPIFRKSWYSFWKVDHEKCKMKRFQNYFCCIEKKFAVDGFVLHSYTIFQLLIKSGRNSVERFFVWMIYVMQAEIIPITFSSMFQIYRLQFSVSGFLKSACFLIDCLKVIIRNLNAHKYNFLHCLHSFLLFKRIRIYANRVLLSEERLFRWHFLFKHKISLIHSETDTKVIYECFAFC